MRGGKLYDTFGPKVISSRITTADGALASRAVFISIMPSGRFLPELERSTQEKLANQFQGQVPPGIASRIIRERYPMAFRN